MGIPRPSFWFCWYFCFLVFFKRKGKEEGKDLKRAIESVLFLNIHNSSGSSENKPSKIFPSSNFDKEGGRALRKEGLEKGGRERKKEKIPSCHDEGG